MDDEENCNLNHSSSMATRSENLQREMEFIQAWINNPNIDPLRLIDWSSIGASPINENVTPGLLDMAFPTLFPTGQCDWLEPHVRRIYLHEYIKHLF